VETLALAHRTEALVQSAPKVALLVQVVPQHLKQSHRIPVRLEGLAALVIMDFQDFLEIQDQ
jgi:hypothetical protein